MKCEDMNEYHTMDGDPKYTEYDYCGRCEEPVGEDNIIEVSVTDTRRTDHVCRDCLENNLDWYSEIL